MTNDELDEIYSLLKLKGKLQGISLTKDECLDYQEPGWRFRKQYEEEAKFIAMGIYEEKLTEMTYEQWREVFYVEYMFDIDSKTLPHKLDNMFADYIWKSE